MIEMYDLEGNYICTFDSYLECAKYFNTTRNIIRTHISLSKQGKIHKKKILKITDGLSYIRRCQNEKRKGVSK